MKHKFKIEGIDCPVCASKLLTKIAELDGVDKAKINFFTETLTIETELSQEELLTSIRRTAKAFDPGVSVK